TSRPRFAWPGLASTDTFNKPVVTAWAVRKRLTTNARYRSGCTEVNTYTFRREESFAVTSSGDSGSSSPLATHDRLAGTERRSLAVAQWFAAGRGYQLLSLLWTKLGS